MISADLAGNTKTVVLVDDDPSTANLYSNRLRQAGFRTTSAGAAEEAFEALPDLQADLIIIDLMLPGRRGFQALEAIRADTRHKSTPVLVLSNAYLPELTQRALRVGGNKAVPLSLCTSYELISASRQLVGIAAADETVEVPVQEDGTTEHSDRDLKEAGRCAMGEIRENCVRYVKEAGTEAGNEYLGKLYQNLHALTARAGLGDCWKIAQLTGALEAMLFEHVSRSNAALPPSSMKTLVKAVECLERLLGSGNTGAGELPYTARVLLVDDDMVCNMANEVALKRANYDTARATDGGEALMLLSENDFDLILLDINMPGMNGLEVCERLRRIPRHQNTPVIFVTLSSDFESRAQSMLSGGNDLISKPISPLELIVKATVFLLSMPKPAVRRPRQPGAGESPPQSPPCRRQPRKALPPLRRRPAQPRKPPASRATPVRRIRCRKR
jgi:CheY-like chemotaxis protein